MISIHLHNPLLGVPREPLTIHTEFTNVSSSKKPFKFRKAKTSQLADVIVYNRVPKCGSTTMGFLLEALKKPSNHYFKVENQIQPGQSHRFKSEEDEDRWLSDIQNRTRPTIIVRHQFFTESKKSIGSSKNQVLWINLVRNPVDQFISSYYYMRHGFLKNVNKTTPLNQRYKQGRLSHVDSVTQNMTIDECIQHGHKSCILPKTSYLSYSLN
jgi:dermatan/chondrotin sulfate uronyl 2-O-sulfotransferase UST